MEKKRRRTKEERENSAQIFQLVIVSALLLAYFFTILFNHSAKMKEMAEDIAADEFASHGDKLAMSFAKNISVVSQSVATSAATINSDEGMFSNNNLKILENAVNSSPASYGYISTCEGNAVDINGASLNVWENLDFAQAVTGVSVISDIGNYEGGRNMIAFYSPIVKDGVVNGVVCFQYSADQFARLPRTSEHDGQTIYCLINKAGIIASAMGNDKPETGVNLLDIISDRSNKETVSLKKKLEQNLINNKNSEYKALVNDKERFVVCRMVGINSWYVAELYSLDYYNRIVDRSYLLTRAVTSKIVFAIVLFFAAVIAIILINRALYSRRNEELQSKAETDLLTGLLNKIATEKHIQEYLEGDGINEPGMLFVLDVDNFKKINDTMGHAFGDQVLATLGVKLRNQFRSSDIIGRIGGDEFMVYLKKIPDENTQQKEANKMINFFRSFQAGDYVKYSATASIGVSLYPQDGKTFEELYKAADKGVYLSKQRGKNQLAFYSETKSAPAENK